MAQEPPAELVETAREALTEATTDEEVPIDYEGDRYLVKQAEARQGTPVWDEDAEEEVTVWHDCYTFYIGRTACRRNQAFTTGGTIDDLAERCARKMQYHSERVQRRIDGQRQFERGLMKRRRGFL